jgi:hypothetical protein
VVGGYISKLIADLKCERVSAIGIPAQRYEGLVREVCPERGRRNALAETFLARALPEFVTVASSATPSKALTLSANFVFDTP